jgi:hypothetical protein
MAVERNGHPIRLIQDNGNVIELMANRLDMNVTRKTGGKPMPWTGSSRYSFDMNINSAMITIQGIFVDDTVATSDGSKASTIINFARSVGDDDGKGVEGHENGESRYGHGGNLQYLFHADNPGTGNTNSEFSAYNNGPLIPAGRFFEPTAGVSKKGLSIQKLDGTWCYIYYNSILGNGSDQTAYDGNDNSANPTVNVDFKNNHQVRAVTSPSYAGVNAPSLALAVTNCINNHSSLSPYFTAERIDTENATGYTRVNCGVKITYKDAGFGGDKYIRGHPPSEQLTSKLLAPYTDPPFFTGGMNVNRKSAADKVQDLWGIVNNSIPSSVGSSGDNNTILSMFRTRGGLSRLWGGKRRQHFKGGDYIVGLQIPYNSMVQTTSADDMYVARNFLVPVGRFSEGVVEGGADDPFGSKGSEANMLDAGVEFNRGNNVTGIVGTVTKLDISYDAGENVYVFTMIFAPINKIG